MFLYMAFIIMFSLTTAILFAESPLTLGLWLILSTLMASMFMSFMTTKWFGIILFLVYVGGLLVMFSYFSATAPNQLTDTLVMLYTSLTSSLILYTLGINKFTPSMAPQAPSSHSLSQMYILSSQNFIPLTSAAIILFITMVTVIKIAPTHQGPLRPFNS